MWHQVLVIMFILWRNSRVDAETDVSHNSNDTADSAKALQSPSAGEKDSLANEVEWWNNPRLSINAFNATNGNITDPMDGFDPKRVQCVHRGAYFLPHPDSCEQYFLCAFGHLLMHSCGLGTAWSYRRAQCEMYPEAECYSNAASNTTTTKKAFPTTVCFTYNVTSKGSIVVTSAVKTGFDSAATKKSTTVKQDSDQTMLEYTKKPTTRTRTRPQTTTPTSTRVQPTTRTPKPTKASIRKRTTAGSTSVPTSHSTKTTTKATTTNSEVFEDFFPNCVNGAKYLADVNDCTHYFICIQGLPIGMFCPATLYWDSKIEMCSSSKAHCLQTQ